MPEYLTTKELAQLLRIKERKVYDLAASGAVPCSKAMGKLLFPTQAIHDWLAQNSSGLESVVDANVPNVILGSHDPLLDWALRESQCSMASFFDGSADGLERFVNGEGVATGLHLYDATNQSWNNPAVTRCIGLPVVMVEWAKRQRGLIVRSQAGNTIKQLSDLAGKRVVPRQAQAGAQALLLALLAQIDLPTDSIAFQTPVHTESDAALAVLEGSADAAFGLQALAVQYQLGFVPIIEERFDLLVNRRAWFEPAMQTLIDFGRSEAFRVRAQSLSGYDVSGFGTVHFNG